jgi:hypothetical protein
MQFAYEAKSGPHQIVRGELEAENERAAVEQLTAKGLFLTSIRPAKQSVYPTPISKSSAASSKVSAKNLSLFTTQMSDLLGAGLTVVKSLDIITTQTNHARLKEIVGRIRDSVKEGKSFSASLAAFPSLFNSFYINMVRALQLILLAHCILCFFRLRNECFVDPRISDDCLAFRGRSVEMLDFILRCFAHRDDRRRTSHRTAKDQSIRHALEEACLVWVSMEDEVVHRAHERSGATQWHIEVRREEEIGFALLNEIGKRHLLAKRIVGEWRLFHRDTR